MRENYFSKIPRKLLIARENHSHKSCRSCPLTDREKKCLDRNGCSNFHLTQNIFQLISYKVRTNGWKKLVLSVKIIDFSINLAHIHFS